MSIHGGLIGGVGYGRSLPHQSANNQPKSMGVSGKREEENAEVKQSAPTKNPSEAAPRRSLDWNRNRGDDKGPARTMVVHAFRSLETFRFFFLNSNYFVSNLNQLFVEFSLPEISRAPCF